MRIQSPWDRGFESHPYCLHEGDKKSVKISVFRSTLPEKDEIDDVGGELPG